MADIIVNVSGEDKTLLNTKHLLAHTVSGGQAVYTEESETTTAYLLTDPTGEMPTFEGGVVRSTSSDGSVVFAAMNGSETAADGIVMYFDQSNFAIYYYSAKEKDLTKADQAKIMGDDPPTSDADSVALHIYAGWTFFNELLIKPMTTSEMQADLRKCGGIALDTFDLSAMDAYLAGMLVRSEIAVAKYAQADWMQGDPTKPDYVNNRIGGFFLPDPSVRTIEWNGEVGNLPQLFIGEPPFVQVYKGNIYKEHFYGATITVTTKVGDAAPTTDESTLDQSIVAQKFQDEGYICAAPEVGLFIFPRDFSFEGINFEAGLYLSKNTSTSTSNDVTTTTVRYTSKIEFAQQREPVIVPINKMWLPSDLSGGNIEIATSNNVGGVKNPNVYTESSDDVTAYVQSDGLIKVPVKALAVPTTTTLGGVMNPSSYTEGDTERAYVDNTGYIQVPIARILGKCVRTDTTKELTEAEKANALAALGLTGVQTYLPKFRGQLEVATSNNTTLFLVTENGVAIAKDSFKAPKLTLKSSTSGSVKTFDLTVDDTGEIPTSFYKTIADKVDELEMFKQNGGSWQFIQRIVRSGDAAKIFSVGDQLVCKHETYGKLVWDIIGIDHDTPADSKYTHSMTLQLHDCLPDQMEFDAAETAHTNESRQVKGSNSWAESGIRQWLNSDKSAKSWWKSQSEFDVKPSYAFSKDGFLKGFGADFLAVIGNVTKVTIENTVRADNSVIKGDQKTTTNSERFFLLSKTEVYGGDNRSVAEGSAYPYYSERSTLSEPGTVADENRKKTINGGNSGSVWWILRSSDAGSLGDITFVYGDTGMIGYTAANIKNGIAPACCIV